MCTDCHFSLQIVTVASASALQAGASGVEVAGDSPDGSRPAMNGDDGALSRDGRGGDGSGGGVARRPTGLVTAIGEVVQEVFFGVDLSGDFGGPGFLRGVRSSAESSGLDYSTTGEVAGDVVLAGVLEWGRIQVRASCYFALLRGSFDIHRYMFATLCTSCT